ncbi:hypothetical protein [Algibacter pectinivorans]|uniref:Glycine dehydrogenase n=1 Tax=Algibacter pectinivorans TaxID=870482 RepID=A0A1I1MCZ1_9FLAO|nr:hypothetical protein [Algibacter pectinivorans]SFC83055.1 hypothetical protein SAMN04487987_101169 [Algibacter pectinivorans]
MSKIKFIIPCEEANHVCDKSQYKNASIREKIALNLHLIFCRACRKYSSNNSKLTKTIKKAEVECLDQKSKEAMREDFNQALKEISS